MLRNADYLLQLMQQQVQQLVNQDQQLQAFLEWVSQKAAAVATPYKPVTVRAFYFDMGMTRELGLVGGTLDLARGLDFDLARTLAVDFELALDRALARALALISALNLAFDRVRAVDRILALARVLTAVLALALVRAHGVDLELERSLQELKEQISYSAEDGERFYAWWKANGEAWTEQLRAVFISYRHIGQDWQFSTQQKDLLRQYYDTNQLLVDCLNSARYLTRTIRQGIEESLLLPTLKMSNLNG
jgi:predicted NACHT family NTPase